MPSLMPMPVPDGSPPCIYTPAFRNKMPVCAFRCSIRNQFQDRRSRTADSWFSTLAGTQNLSRSGVSRSHKKDPDIPGHVAHDQRRHGRTQEGQCRPIGPGNGRRTDQGGIACD